MKRLFILLCSIELIFLPAFAFAEDKIEDEFAKETLKNITPIQNFHNEQITDDFVQNNIKVPYKRTFPNRAITDDFAQENLQGKKSNVRINTNYDYTSLDRTVLKISPSQTISTKRKFTEGMEVSFITKNDVKINSTAIPQGSEIIARVETISPNALRGVPSQLTIDNFYLKSNPDIYFVGSINKTGARRYLWVYPSSVILSVMFGMGSLLWLVKGGNAKIRKRQTFEIFYAEN